jgi:tetratricopeptide (TPR) repeat protein
MSIAFRCAALAGLVVTAACGTQSHLEASDDYMREGLIRFAYREVENERSAQMAAGGHVDPEVEARWRELRLLYLQEVARQDIYADHELAALDHLAAAAELDPENKETRSLRDRAKLKLAVRATGEGQSQLAKGEMAAALQSFGAALQHWPGYPPALRGTEAVKQSVARLHEVAQQQFLEAIRKMPELRFFEVDWHTSAAIARDPSREDAEELRQRATHELALASQNEALRSQESGSYGAALMGYRSARDLWPDLPGIGERIEHMQREVEAQWRIERAALAIRGQRVEEARKLLAEAATMSSLEQATISELLLEARKQEGRIKHAAARDLELQGKKAEALALFVEVSVEWPDGLLDEKTRIGALQSDIEGAEKAFAEGEAAEEAKDLPAALKHYREAATYYAKYRDVAERVARLAAAIEKPDGVP